MTSHESFRASGPSQELVLRLASAVVLVCLTLVLTWSGLWPFAVLVGCVTLVVAWEWGRVVRAGTLDQLFWMSAGVLIVAVTLAALAKPSAALGLLIAGAAGVAALDRRRDGNWAALGILYVGLAAVSLVWLRSDSQHGLDALIVLMLIVWGADSGAFVFGRTIGGPKLWPQISPNKTWAGLLGAVLVGSFAAWAFAVGVVGGSGPRSAAIGAALAFISQVGDLIESAIKRQHGVKDASGLIPGHGGFMDRVDGLIFAAVAGAIYAGLTDSSAPGAALLSLKP